MAMGMSSNLGNLLGQAARDLEISCESFSPGMGGLPLTEPRSRIVKVHLSWFGHPKGKKKKKKKKKGYSLFL